MEDCNWFAITKTRERTGGQDFCSGFLLARNGIVRHCFDGGHGIKMKENR
jgi:hypothetical protein